jgi:hypothetical protein
VAVERFWIVQFFLHHPYWRVISALAVGDVEQKAALAGVAAAEARTITRSGVLPLMRDKSSLLRAAQSVGPDYRAHLR